jgi:hypothetical protein
MIPNSVRAATIVTVVVAVLGVGASAASASMSVSSFQIAPSGTQAGGNPNVTVAANFSYTGADSIENATIALAPGLLANPTAATVCPASEFAAETCPSSSQIGTGSIAATAPSLSLNLTLPVSIYLIAPQGSELGRIGVIANLDDYPVASLSAPIDLRTSPNIGVSIPLSGIPDQVDGISTQINGISLTLYGTVNGKPFTRLPTACGSAGTGITVTSYGAPSTPVTADAAFTPTGCSSLPYSPKLAGSVTLDSGDQGVSFDASITQASDQAATESVTLGLPSGLAPNLTALSSACTSANLASCPSVGTASVTTPLYPSTIQGKIVLAATGASLPALDAVFPAPFNLTLQGTPSIGAGGGLEAAFTGIPDFPITNLQVDLAGGSASLLTAGGTLCSKAQTVTASFIAQSGATADSSPAVTVNGCPPGSGPNGGSAAPNVTHVRLAGLGAGHAKLSFKASAVRTISIALPSGLHFSRKALRHLKGLSVSGAKLKLVKLNKGRVVLTFKQAAREVTVTIKAPLLSESSTLQVRVRKHKTKHLSVHFKLTDAEGGVTSLARTPSV